MSRPSRRCSKNLVIRKEVESSATDHRRSSSTCARARRPPPPQPPPERAAHDGRVAEEVASLRKELVLVKELIQKGEAANIQVDFTASLTPPLERIEAEVKSLGRLSEKDDALKGTVQSQAKELSRQTKLQAVMLALAALVFLMLLIKLTLRP